RDRKLLAVRRPDGTQAVPAAFLDGGHVVKGLHGTLTLLCDCGFGDVEALRWLFTDDESLPGTPINAIRQHRRSEVHRRSQALGSVTTHMSPSACRSSHRPGAVVAVRGWRPGWPAPACRMALARSSLTIT